MQLSPAPLHPVHTVVLTLHLVCCCFIFFFLLSFFPSFSLSVFQFLPGGTATGTYEEANKDDNKEKNRYPNILPCERTLCSAAPRLSVDSQPENTVSCFARTCFRTFFVSFCFFLFLFLTADSSRPTSTNTVAYSNHLFFSVSQDRIEYNAFICPTFEQFAQQQHIQCKEMKKNIN